MDVLKATEMVVAEVVGNAPEGVKFPPTWRIELYRNNPNAGKAQGTCTIKINSDLAEQYPEQLRDTVVHEMAHCLTYLNQPSRVKPHGPEWQDMMYLLGATPETCHRMEQPNLKRVKHRLHAYRCGCSDHRIKTGRHMNMVMGEKTYICRKCRTPLIYQGAN